MNQHINWHGGVVQFGHSTNYGMQQGTMKLSTKGPQLQLVKRSSNTNQMATIPRTQSITTPKPVIKFTPGKLSIIYWWYFRQIILQSKLLIAARHVVDTSPYKQYSSLLWCKRICFSVFAIEIACIQLRLDTEIENSLSNWYSCRLLLNIKYIVLIRRLKYNICSIVIVVLIQI